MRPSWMEREFEEIFERCQRRYPSVELDPEVFYRRLEEVLASGHHEHALAEPSTRCSGCETLLGQWHHEDLFLALACATGNRIAWEHFSDDYLPLVGRLASRACRESDVAADLAQQVVTMLLGESLTPRLDSAAGRQPSDGIPIPAGKLAGYSGRGSLAGWLRATVAHAAVDRFRRERKQVSLDDLVERGNLPECGDQATARGSEESLDSHWGGVLLRALESEIAALCARDRLILCLYYLQGVSLKKIALHFGVHEATVSRQLDRMRRDVHKRVERNLRKRHGLRASDLKSLWHWAAEAGGPAFAKALDVAPFPAEGKKKVQRGILGSS